MGLWQLATYSTSATSRQCTIQSRARTSSIRSGTSCWRSTFGALTRRQRLTTQLKNLSIPFTENFSSELSPSKNDYALDAIFGFSFTGEVRQPFPPVIEALAHSPIPVLAVDAPSSWNIESGPPSKGVGHDYQPASLISLTAPKPLVKWFVNRPENGRAEKRRHFVGGRFLEKKTADKYEIDLAP